MLHGKKQTLYTKLKIYAWNGFFSLGLAISFAAPAQAYFTIEAPLKPSEFQGEAEPDDFKGLEEVPVPKPALKGYEHQDYSRASTRFRHYARGRLNFGKLKLERINNKTSSGDQAGFPIFIPEITKDFYGIELAYGYAYQHFRLEGETIFFRHLDYNVNPVVLDTTSLDLKSEICSYNLLGNLYYDFTHVFAFEPYIFVTLGLAMHHVKSDIAFSRASDTGDIVAGTLLGTRSTATLAPAWGFGLGSRYRILPNWYIDFFMRYLSMGFVKWKPTDEDASRPLKLKGDYSFQGFGIGLHYLF